MKKGRIVAMIGFIIMIFGSIFHLQGHSIIGPESSFMYSNPDWITYGIQISIIGIVILGTGLAIVKRK
jgi:hypothetical protein